MYISSGGIKPCMGHKLQKKRTNYPSYKIWNYNKRTITDAKVK